MGRQAECTVSFLGTTAAGVAHLEAEKLSFRGGAIRLRIPFKEVTNVETQRGHLHTSRKAM
ncbi:MAG TPA: hypothetical protein VM120_29195 [Bryobacteraceae bacterium]|nr:hypothetical protein [Bryobacteraceae bacterium]